MNLQQLLEMVDDLPSDDRERLKAYLMESQPVHWNSGKEWLTLLDAALNDFWADTTPEERTEILVAIQTIANPRSINAKFRPNLLLML